MDSQIPEPRHSDIQALDEAEFVQRFQNQFTDPTFAAYQPQIAEMARLAWQAQLEGRKAPLTHKAGPGFADPDYALSDDWRRSQQAVLAAQQRQADPAGPARILVISASDRNDKTCPGEVSKSRRLMQAACQLLSAQPDLGVTPLDLSLVTSEYGRMIYPCKGCVSTAMPLCHWPCSCYPNYALGQVNDWMAEIYPLWVEAHGVLIITPVYWYAPPSVLKLMMDRLVCADGGNPDPSSTQGKEARQAKALELAGWGYPRHLAVRLFALVVHGDTAGVDHLRMALSAWLRDIQLLPAGQQAELGRYIGYYGPYASSHEALDQEQALLQEIRNTALGLAQAVRAARSEQLAALQPELPEPRPK